MVKSNRKHTPYIIMGMKRMSENWVKPVYLALGETAADYESLDDHQLIQLVSQVDKDALEALVRQISNAGVFPCDGHAETASACRRNHPGHLPEHLAESR